MPGKQPRAGEAPLSRPQSQLAAQILRRSFNPEINTQMDMEQKTKLLAEINETFKQQGYHDSFYSLRKMEDWRANCVYRWKCRQQKKKPDCWGTDGRKRCRKARKNRENINPEEGVQEGNGPCTHDSAMSASTGMIDNAYNPMNLAYVNNESNVTQMSDCVVVEGVMPGNSAIKRTFQDMTNTVRTSPFPPFSPFLGPSAHASVRGDLTEGSGWASQNVHEWNGTATAISMPPIGVSPIRPLISNPQSWVSAGGPSSVSATANLNKIGGSPLPSPMPNSNSNIKAPASLMSVLASAGARAPDKTIHPFAAWRPNGL